MLICSSNSASQAVSAGQADPNTRGYILEAENATGDWLTGSVRNGIHSDVLSLDLLRQTVVDGWMKNSYAEGAYVTSEMASGATSSLVFTPPAPGYYLIGARIQTREGEEDKSRGTPILTLLLRDEQGQAIPNELEAQAKGYTWSVPAVSLPVVGLWKLPAEPVILTFQSGASRFIFVDYFYLAPVFEARGGPSAFLPISPWPAKGDWIWGRFMDWGSIATTTPGAASWIQFQVPVAGEYAIYVAAWHDGDYEHLIDFHVGEGESALTSQITLPVGTYWQLERLGPFYLSEGEMPFRFTNNRQNPRDAAVAITALFMVPKGLVVSELPTLVERETGAFRIDGLRDDWADVPVLIADSEGDQLLNSDIKELRVAIADGFLYIMVDFYSLAEQPGFLFDIDLDGNHEPEFVIEGVIESRWLILGYQVDSLRFGQGKSASFEVIELSIPLSLLDPSIWKQHPPDTMPPEFDPEGVSGFYIRYRLIQGVEPLQVLDETDWGYIEVWE
jgi:hypothetical protein